MIIDNNSHLSAMQSRARAHHDRGNVLPMVLVMMVVGSLMVMALLTFALTLLKNRPPLEERSDSLEAVRSAMRMAIVMQRDHGPEGCYETNDPNFVINGRAVEIRCLPIRAENDNGGRFGLITTSNNGLGNGNLPDNEPIKTGAGNQPKEVFGAVYLNGGQLAGDNAGLHLIDGQLVGSAYSSGTTSPYRYTQIDIDTEITYPVGTFTAGSTCSTLFGPDIVEQTFDTGLLAPSAAAPLQSSTDASGVLRVERAGGSNALILGVVVQDDAATLRLVRRSTGGNVQFDIPGPAVNAGNPAIACYQDLVDPSTDPTAIPPGFTFCGGPLIDPELVSQAAAAGDGITCDPLPWWDYAGWKPNLLTEYVYPMLPQVPTYTRPSAPIQVGTSSCYVFYPGRYNDPIELTSGNEYYFASGVYLLNDELRVENGSRVVAGEGTYKGCAFDADAAFLPGSPRNHEITGKGATFLLGSSELASSAAVPATNGRIEVDNASLRVNRRVATTSTRASSGVSVMSINLARTGTTRGDVEIPANDRILLPSCLGSEIAQMDIDAAAAGTTNPCAADVTTYSIRPTAAIGDVYYTKSGLGPDDVIIEARLDGSTRSSNRVLFGGNVFVPNSQIVMSRTQANDDYAVRLGNGAVASSMSFDFPVGDDTTFLIGQQAATAYQQVKLVATTTFNGQDFRSVAELEVDTADRYAINSWTVDAGSGDPLAGVGGVGGGDGTTAGGTTAGGTTAGGTTAGGTTAGGTTAGGTTAGGTTAGGTTAGGTTAGGTTAGGTTAGGTTAGGTTAGGTTAGGTTAGGTTAGGTTAGGTTAGGTTAGGTTAGGTTAGGTTAGGTTDGGTTAGGTTDGGPVVDPCLGEPTWTAEWWNNTTLSGTPDLTTQEAVINNDWGSGAPQPGIDADGFSVRWTRKITVAEDGNYLFTIGGDDGYRLKVDGGPWIANNWSDHSYEEESGLVALTAGCAHEVVMEFYENGGDAVAILSYSTTPDLPDCPNPEDSQWRGDYYNSTNYSRDSWLVDPSDDWRSYRFSRYSDTLNFDWGNGSPNRSRLGNDTYSIRFTKTINLDQPGLYRFDGAGNNGFRLFVNNQEVFDDWGNPTYRSASGEIQINDRCGVELVYEFYENVGSAAVSLDEPVLVN